MRISGVFRERFGNVSAFLNFPGPAGSPVIPKVETLSTYQTKTSGLTVLCHLVAVVA